MKIRFPWSAASSIALALSLASASLANGRPVAPIDRIPLVPAPAVLEHGGVAVPFPTRISVVGLDARKAGEHATVETFERLFQVLPSVQGDFEGDASYRVAFERSTSISNPEGYELVSTAEGITVRAGTDAGAFYGAQTAYQLLAYAYHGATFLDYSELPKEGWGKRSVPLVTIRDEPAYRVRSFMADMGRAPFSVPLLKRVVRIMAQLKMNTLHLRLYDDQLCAFRFKSLPLGSENPFAIDADDLAALVRYARQYHIAVIPEMESWGHVASIIYHYPELNGGEGVYAGASFAVGEKTYALLEKMYDEVVPCLEEHAAVHVGLDEAGWAVLPGEEQKGHTPTNMVGRVHEILMRVAAKHRKQITMHLWADHGGRPLPADIEAKVVVEPWRYLGSDAPAIVESLKKHGGAGKPQVVMGAGSNYRAYNGNYEATRLWCQEGVKYPNVLGVTLCQWGSNDIGGRLVTLYGGADFAWTPATPRRTARDTTGEQLRQLVDRRMRDWQIIFPDASPAALAADRGPEVVMGRYAWAPYAGSPVAPTVDFGLPKGTK